MKEVLETEVRVSRETTCKERERRRFLLKCLKAKQLRFLKIGSNLVRL